MGKSQRTKGVAFEREVVRQVNEHGEGFLTATRVPLSGALEEKGDIRVSDPAGELERWECKRRARGFKTLYDALGEADAVVVRDDRKEALIVYRLRRRIRELRGTS